MKYEVRGDRYLPFHLDIKPISIFGPLNDRTIKKDSYSVRAYNFAKSLIDALTQSAVANQAWDTLKAVSF